MSTLITSPDALSFSGNLKNFEISSVLEVTFVLQQGATEILNEKYMPNADGLVTVNVAAIVDRLLDVVIPPDAQALYYIQNDGALEFTATIDDQTPFEFRVIKGGVNELDTTAEAWLANHFLTWQPQDKVTLQTQPEWLGIFAIQAGNIKFNAYYADGTTAGFSILYLADVALYSINVSWESISRLLIGDGSDGNVVAWDIWNEVNGNRVTPIYRYRLRNKGDDEHVYIWANTLGGIDSMSFTGACEQDYKLVHKTALFEGDTINEYDVEKPREYRQSTGYLERYEAEWIADFFYSRKKYMIRFDGAVKRIAVTGSKIVDTSQQDEVDYEFTYRLGEDLQLLNLDRVNADLPAPEGLDTFFLTELLSGLTVAQYSDNLIIAVQNPYSYLWQQLSVAQLWGGLLPSLVDGKTITYLDGKLTAVGGTTIINNSTWTDIQNYINNILNVNNTDSSTRLISGAIPWKSGLTFSSTDLVYKILGVQYTALAKELTCAASDPDLPRMDVFYVDTNSNLQIATGTPAENPATPVLGPTQFAIMTVLIGAGAITPSDLEVTIIYDENVEWEMGAWVDVVGSDQVTVITSANPTSPQSGSLCLSLAIEVPDQAVSYSTHYIGEKFGGGTIFWLDATGKRGLIAADTDAVTSVVWESLSGHNVYSTNGTGTAIGTGQANTALMLISAAAYDWAVSYCANFISGGFDDWFMPSLAELQAMWTYRYNIGYFANSTYWSSSETAWNKAWLVSFNDGIGHNFLKSNTASVRPIRAFDESTLPSTQPVLQYAPENTAFMFYGPEVLAVKDGILTFWLKSTDDWLQNSMLMVESYRGVVQTGRVVITPASHLFDYQPGNETWQRVTLPMYYFAPANPGVDGFKFSLVGSWPNNITLWFDNIQYQHSMAVPPDGGVQTTGTFGSAAKQLQITVNQDGKVTEVVEIAVPEWLDFTFCDLATRGERGYILNLKARVDYVIESLVLWSDGGCEVAIFVMHDGVGHSVPGLDWIMATTDIVEFTPTSDNIVYAGDQVALSTGAFEATEISGQLNFRRL